MRFDPADELRIIVEPGGLTITRDSYRTRQQDREIGDRVMARLGYDPNDVIEIRMTEGAVEVDWIERLDDRRVRANDDRPIIHTTRHELSSDPRDSTRGSPPTLPTDYDYRP